MTDENSGQGFPDKFFTILQIADMLSVSEATVRRWIHKEHLRGYRFGDTKTYRVAARDLYAFIANSQTQRG